jgi:prophage tail gpP-like protein
MDDLLLIAGETEISGWESIQVTRGIERCPSSFELTMSERYPYQREGFVVKAGDPCSLYIGPQDAFKGDYNGPVSVIVGYVDRVGINLAPGTHTITVSGRGKCADLVDCAAIWNSGQMANVNAFTVATFLAAPYGIGVSLKNMPGQAQLEGPNGAQTATALGVGPITDADFARAQLPMIPRLNLSWGNTVYNEIEQIARYSGLLVYEDTDGNLVLARTGSNKPMCWLSEGENVEAASINFSMDQRYSKYIVRMLGTNVLGDLGNGGDLLMEADDDNVPRRRVHYIIAENGDAGGNVAKQRGIWEMKRRWGQSNQIRVTTDSWRGQDGNLWEPNTLIAVNLPALKIPDPSTVPFWLISEVSYERNGMGTHAHLVLTPPESFTVEPILPPWEKGFSDVKA